MTFIDPSAETASLPTEPAQFYGRRAKRALDLVLVLVALPVLLPVVALLAAFIAMDGGSPFYAQRRIGRNARSFRMWKLRTMVTDADRALERHLDADPRARAEWNAKQKLACDPRITRFGRFLRRSSLDELPQVFNVLAGDMSLVGPRPMMTSQVGLYPGRAYYALRPGMTGPWQVSDRNACSFADRASFDAGYLRTLSLMGDLRLLGATIRVVLRGTGC
jgi:lipopolysaccharide/colanic/teichoic acid biosynthesis glycosyltransferase